MKSIKLLIVEDSEDDTFLLIRQLEKNDFNVSYKRVEDALGLIELIENESWDIVIADHTLPTFDSTEALEIIKAKKIDLPLIILSGNINPKIAVEAMRNGAKDFIMKDDTTRLIPAINRELYEKMLRAEKTKADSKIRFLAFHDCLTGLVNRIEFERRLDIALKSAKEKEITHSLLYMDLDYFKIVNDTCGHLAGDELLKQLSSKLLTLIRDRDTLARIGGDEFCILLSDCPLDRALEIAKDVNKQVNDYVFTWSEKTFKVGVSIGVLTLNKDSGNAASVLTDVDLACYSAKHKGRNLIQVFEKDTEEFVKIKNDVNWVSELDRAIDNNNFVLYKQNIVPLQTTIEENSHHEILLRLQKDNELIFPDTFIPAAERYYKMTDVDLWVINNSLKLLHESTNKARCLSINLSGHSLANDLLYDFINNCLQKYNINPTQICFEITETAAISNFQDAQKFFSSIKDIGCKLSLDDFGTGLSSFSYLKHIPVDYVKIDGNFIKNIHHDDIDKAIVESINDITHKLGAKTIAEFVESDDIKKVLTDIGIDYAQGYGIHKPEQF